ncbi:hypothetical protein ACHAWO_008570 [Cyclotella atomus]|jgi:hypothetical protein|uniref:C2H2-type domain-containing protein n=1 Tax=Cyclotella atomus TaxID=382360 RepID=A0ABD3PG45_9STRA
MNSFNRAPHTKARRSISSRELKFFEEHIDGPTFTNGAAATAPMQRLVERDLPYHQSSNSLRIRHQSSKRNTSGLRFFHWYIEDWFHVLLRLRTVVSILMFVTIWTLFLLFFAGVYVLVDRKDPEIDCGLGKVPNPIHFSGAFAFSLETTTTVGYGIPNGGNAFFENCPRQDVDFNLLLYLVTMISHVFHLIRSLQVAIYFQMLISMFFNAFLLSFMFARLARSEARAAQVLFANKAIINREVLENGITRYLFSARIYDADSRYPIVEAHARFYAVKHRSMHAEDSKDMRFPIKMEAMRICKPNDDYGALLYTSIPITCTHHIDIYSPILPPTLRKLGPENGRVMCDSGFVLDSCGLDLRENDSYVGSRDSIRCAVCGETYSTIANLIQHIRYNQLTEKYSDIPVSGSHQELDVGLIFGDTTKVLKPIDKSNNNASSSNNESAAIDIDKPTPPWYEEYKKYLSEANVEILVVMEAIDPITSGTFQAIQSYTVDDIEFDKEFAPCVLTDTTEDVSKQKNMWWKIFRRAFVGRTAVGRAIKIDLDTFHETVNVGEGCS